MNRDKITAITDPKAPKGISPSPYIYKDQFFNEPINIALDFLANTISRGCENHKVDKLVLTEEGLKRIIITIHDCDMNGNLSLKDKEINNKQQ
jgi:hypothetical protein